ncbi:MAG TPA: glycosyl hydrolase [Candidatus Dormibacteraeota bacterium]|nr:glycosyl hydrolase [Candidatus Dormibacteraeota bacterium]
MTTIYMAADDTLLCVREKGGRWQVERQLEGRRPRCVAIDPLRPERVWCGTAGSGLWRSLDGGASWRSASARLATASVSAVAVSPNERAGADGVVYAGTDPSALFRSDDGGLTWEALPGMLALPSAPSWSFPPRPETSHVRWIALDPWEAGTLYVCIEAGALVRSRDGGHTWDDRVPDGPRDTHTLAVHPRAPGRLYSAAGDGFSLPGHGYNESRDRGDTWTHPGQGIERHYLYGLAVDPGDPDTILVSAATSPRTAHDPAAADATIYRRSGDGPWQEAREGLPETNGSLRAFLAANPVQPGTFYAGNNRGLFRSADAGITWERIPTPIPVTADHAIAVSI